MAPRPLADNSDSSLSTTWDGLSPGWHRAFQEAWQSWCSGDLGIGAALVDPASDVVVAAGRNRVNQTAAEPRTLTGNFMAHAEMNAFAAFNGFKADGLDLYTTLEPCLMCAATAIFLHVDRVFHAVDDEYFVGVHDLWDHHPYSARNKHESIGPLPNRLAAFARVLPLQAQSTTVVHTTVMDVAGEHIPTIAALAIELTEDRTLHTVRDGGGDVLAALDALWGRLPRASVGQ